jgi:hypothetical protein
MGGDLDSRKLALDERRLEFEVSKYEQERGRRELDLEKAREELNALKRPFYKNPAYLGPLATICVAVLGGFFAFGTNLLNRNVVSLGDQKKHLEEQKDGLTPRWYLPAS